MVGLILGWVVEAGLIVGLDAGAVLVLGLGFGVGLILGMGVTAGWAWVKWVCKDSNWPAGLITNLQSALLANSNTKEIPKNFIQFNLILFSILFF